jgi:isoquinoline 1-oxidoreductase/isoquinoline 1-oxidoreductase beta subunit
MSGIKLTRRGFLKTSGIVGGGLLIGYVAMPGENLPAVIPTAGGIAPNAFIQLTAENKIVFYSPRDEMGQGVYMGLTTLVAEELDVPPQDIQVEFASVHDAYNHPEYVVQGTGGSSSMRVHYLPLRQVAADTRALLLNAAAQDLAVPLSALTTDNGHIGCNGSSYPYSDFIATAETMELPIGSPLKAKVDFKYIGQDIARNDALAKSTGTAVYGVDIDLPDMHYSLVSRSPVAGGTVVSFDDSAARAVTGVTDIVQIDSGVAVVAKSFWQAKKAIAALSVTWDQPALADYSSAQIKADYQAAIDSGEGDSKSEGNIEEGLQLATKQVEREFWTPYLAHTPMEPVNAVVRIANGKAELWAGTQGPSTARGLVARHAQLPEENVTVHSLFSGGGFGRRTYLSHVSEATQVAAATDKTIKLLWTRENDVQNGWFRQASIMKVLAGVDSQGLVTVWNAARAGGDLMPHSIAGLLPGAFAGSPDWVNNMTVSALESLYDGWIIDSGGVEGLINDYDFPNRKLRHISVNHGLPLAAWRSVGHSFTAFAKETVMDELAEQAGIDSIDFRKRNLQGNPRLLGALEALEKGLKGWQLEEGRHIGIAAHGSFQSYVAQAAEVSVEEGNIRVHRVLCAIDCGQVVNPAIVRGQMEGAIMYGLTAVLYGDIQIENGAVKESNFHDYKMLRINEAPAVEVIIVESDQPPTGVGEPGLPPVGPAVANAVYRATGERLTSTPLQPA